jgi:hypothetical protein
MSTLPVVVTASNTSGLTATANAVININDVAPVSLFTTQTPTQPNETDGAGSAGDYELGMRFSASVNGTITGIRYWKAASETGTHTGRIWSNTGTLLASVVFTGETASGWQTKALATPLNITAGAQYVVSVNVTSRYACTSSVFSSAVSNGGLTAPVGAGIFNTAPGSFPTASFSNTNYFRDVVFVPGAAAPIVAPVVTAGNFGVSLPATAGQVVGTMTATGAPTSWEITAGNAAGYFSISNAGVITTTAAIVAGNYSLTCSAINSAGSGSGAASIAASVPVVGSIPLSKTDPRFAANTNGSTGGTKSGTFTNQNFDNSPGYSNGNQVFFTGGTLNLNKCVIDWREGPRLGGNVTVDECFIHVIGFGQDHADGFQGYLAGNTNFTLKNSCIRGHSDPEAQSIYGSVAIGTTGIFWADASSGSVTLQNVIIWGGARGIAIYADSGVTTRVSFDHVYFVPSPNGSGWPFYDYDIRGVGGTLVVDKWDEVRAATIVNGVLVPGALLPRP